MQKSNVERVAIKSTGRIQGVRGEGKEKAE